MLSAKAVKFNNKNIYGNVNLKILLEYFKDLKKMSNIAQIFISEGGYGLSKDLQENCNKVKNLYPDYSYKLFDDDLIKSFLSKYYESYILNTYQALVPFSYKSDFARFCILYQMGGWYFDIGLKLNKRFEVSENINLVFFRDVNFYTQTSWGCAGGIIFSKPGNKILSKAIQLIVDNVKNKYYGLTPLCPTGPTLWGRAIASLGIDENVIIGDFQELTPRHKNKNKAMVLPDGTIFAFNKNAPGGDLKSLGCEGTNNYNDLWNAKKIYDNLI